MQSELDLFEIKDTEEARLWVRPRERNVIGCCDARSFVATRNADEDYTSIRKEKKNPDCEASTYLLVAQVPFIRYVQHFGYFFGQPKTLRVLKKKRFQSG